MFAWLHKRGEHINPVGVKDRDLIAMVRDRIDMKAVSTKREWMEQIIDNLKPGWKGKPTAGPMVSLFRSDAPSDRKISEFYASWEWKRLRYDFIKDKQRRCECCGASPTDGIRIVVDHIKPIRRFWHLRLDRMNLQMLCDDCNMGKGSRDETDWRQSNVIPIRSA